jgi:hypothetical protein
MREKKSRRATADYTLQLALQRHYNFTYNFCLELRPSPRSSMQRHGEAIASELTCTERLLLSQAVYEKGTDWDQVSSLLDEHPLIKGRREPGYFSAPVSSVFGLQLQHRE